MENILPTPAVGDLFRSSERSAGNVPHGKAQQHQYRAGKYLGSLTDRFGGQRCDVRTEGTPLDIPLSEEGDSRASWFVGTKIAER